MADYRVTLLVSSCDKDEDTWYPFFKLFTKYWIEFPNNWGIVLNTETKQYSYDGINITCFGGGKNALKLSWTERLYKVISSIEADYIFLTLSDYFILGNVKQKRVEYCIEQMCKHPEVGYMCLFPVESPEIDISDNTIDGFYRCVKGSSFSINAQAGLWRKEYLLQTLKMKKTPWEWEILGSELSGWLNYDIYRLKDEEDMIYPYDWRADGISVYNRQWTRKCVDFFANNDIEVDFEKRGIWDINTEHVPTVMKKDIRYYFRYPFFKRILRYITR